MKNKLTILLIAGFAVTGCSIEELPGNAKNFVESTYGDVKDFVTGNVENIDYKEEGYSMKELEEEKLTVTFYKNIGKEELDLNSGMYASTTTTALKIDQIDKNSKVARPEKDPMRVNYEFDGWHTSQSEKSPFDFDTLIQNNLSLYAHWTQTQEDDFVEPEYVEPSHIDDSIETLVSINGVLNMPIEEGIVKLSSLAMARLNRNPENVTDILNYKIKSDVTLIASFNGTNQIYFTATKDGEEAQEGTINVQNIASQLALNGSDQPTNQWWQNGEKVAQKYDANDTDFEDHRIMLAGSSSMENWANSAEDLAPLHTYNHGIGGTVIEQWKNKLNQRLVYPYSPKSVVYYVGVNNVINTSQNVDEACASLVEMFDDVHAHLPNSHIYYVLINELPNYANKQKEFDQINETAIAYETEHNYLTTINAGKDLLKANEQPNQAYFLMDGLHMSLAGYAIWGKVIKNKLIADLKNA